MEESHWTRWKSRRGVYWTCAEQSLLDVLMKNVLMRKKCIIAFILTFVCLFVCFLFFSIFTGLKQHGCLVITQTFVSRHELMECIAKLTFLNKHRPTVEVVAVLSCHSSCQGQVFSCTPFAVGKQCGFEEFCSLYDFVMACQNVLKDAVMAVHISSCFTLKLDSSHLVSMFLSE